MNKQAEEASFIFECKKCDNRDCDLIIDEGDSCETCGHEGYAIIKCLKCGNALSLPK